MLFSHAAQEGVVLVDDYRLSGGWVDCRSVTGLPSASYCLSSVDLYHAALVRLPSALGCYCVVVSSCLAPVTLRCERHNAE